MTTGAVVLVLAVVGALAFGLWRAGTDGRFRGTHRVRGGDEAGRALDVGTEPGAPTGTNIEEPVSLLVGTPWDGELGERATLLQFSTAFCAPCRATRRVLEEIADVVPGVVHVEVDAEHHLDLVRRVGVTRTPTTIVLDPAGAEVVRAAGAPTKAQVLSALGVALPD